MDEPRKHVQSVAAHMDEDLTRSYRNWRAAEDAERVDDADAAFRNVFQAVRIDAGVGSGFVERTMAAVADTAQRDAMRTRRTRTALISGSILLGAAAAYFGTAFALSVLFAGLRRLLDFSIAMIVGAAAGVGAGVDAWSILGAVGRAAAAVVADSTVMFVILAVQGVAIAALFALQRLLGSHEESFE